MSTVEVTVTKSSSSSLFDTVSRATRLVRKAAPSLRIVTRKSTEARIAFPQGGVKGVEEQVKTRETRIESVVTDIHSTCPPSPLRHEYLFEENMTNKDDAVPKAVRNLRSNHTRSMSVTMPRTTPSTIPPSTPRSERARSRAASTVSYSGPHGPARIRVSSLATISTGVVPKAEAVEPIATGGEETIGSFTPTGCPRQQLHSLLGPATRPRFYSVAGRRSNGSPRGAILPHRRQSMTISNSPPDNAPTMNPDSPIPSICRTPSSYSEDSEYFSTAPSSAGPQTPTLTFSPLPPPMLKLPGQMTTPGMSIPASLAALEEKSKFRVRTHCASCRKLGSNFPCCPRCGEMWCSRECRLRSGNGKRHTCKKDASTN